MKFKCIVQIIFGIYFGFLLIGCASSPRFTSTKAKLNTKVGTFTFVQEGIASYYAEEYHGKATASGEIFNMNELTAAHPTLPFNTKVRVTNLSNGKEVIVRINDRGPFKDDRIIDLSYQAAKEIAMVGPGTARVRVEVIELGTER